MNRGSVRLGTVAAAVLALALAGCGDGGGAAAPAPATPASSPPVPPPPPPPPPPPRPPPPPVNLTATPGDGQVELNWQRPRIPEGTRLSHYEAGVLTSAGEPVHDYVFVIPSERMNVTFTDLTNGHRYLFQVVSADDNGTPDDFEDDIYSDIASVTATPVAPAVPIVTWIGVAEPAEAVVFEGGMVRAFGVVSGEPVPKDLEPINLRLYSDAPEDQVRREPDYDYLGSGIYVLEIQAVEDTESEGPGNYEFVLLPPEEGFPPGIALAEDRAVFRLTVRDVEADPDCSDLQLTGSRFGQMLAIRTGEVVFQGPRRAALRIVEPYLDAFEGEYPALTVLSPTRLPYQELSGGAHRQTMSLNWFDGADLSLTAFAPGCEEVSLSR